MTHDHNDGLAAEYVLGTLSGEERKEFAEAIARDPEMQKLVEAWQDRLADLDVATLPVEPSASLWDRIDVALDDAASGLANSVTLRAGEGAWHEILPGIEKKSLFHDTAANSESFLLRFAPGARLPEHKHRSAEECVVLEGTFVIGDLRLDTGDFQAFEGNTIHPETYCERGGLVYVRGELREAAG